MRTLPFERNKQEGPMAAKTFGVVLLQQPLLPYHRLCRCRCFCSHLRPCLLLSPPPHAPAEAELF